MKVKAIAKYIRIAPRKTRLVVNVVRGLSIDQARKQLMFSRKAAAGPVLKVLNSAVANAENNFDLDTSNYIVSEAFVDGGPIIKRFRPRAHGRAAMIRKRMSHITIAVGPKDDKKMVMKKDVEEDKEIKKDVKKTEEKEVVKKIKTEKSKDKK